MVRKHPRLPKNQNVPFFTPFYFYCVSTFVLGKDAFKEMISP